MRGCPGARRSYIQMGLLLSRLAIATIWPVRSEDAGMTENEAWKYERITSSACQESDVGITHGLCAV
jgi:hypothetical protein